MNAIILATLLAASPAAFGLAQPEQTDFIRYCQGPERSPPEKATLAAMAEQAQATDCQAIKAFFDGDYVSPKLHIKGDGDLRPLMFFADFYALTILAQGRIDASAWQPSPYLVKVKVNGKLAKLPFWGPSVESLILRNTGTIDMSTAGQHEALGFFWIDGGDLQQMESVRELKGLTSLIITNTTITDGDWLPAGSSLRFVDLSSNRMRQVERFRMLRGDIERVFLGGNQLTSVDALIHLPKLQDLKVDDNPIASLTAFAGHQSLRGLYANRTGLRDFRFIESMPRLGTLAIANNGLDDTDIARLANRETPLGFIDLSHNNVTTLAPLRAFSHLYRIGAAHNSITALGSFAPRVNVVEASHNQISDISRLEGDGITSLVLDHNRLSDLSSLRRLPRINTLKLEHNDIVDLEPLMAIEPNLKHLNLSHNKVVTLAPIANMFFKSFFYLDNNPLGTTIPKTEANCPTDGISKAIARWCADK